MNNSNIEGTLVSTYHAENNMGRAEVYRGKRENYILYFDSEGHQFHKEEMDASLHILETKAEDWALGYEVLYG